MSDIDGTIDENYRHHRLISDLIKVSKVLIYLHLKIVSKNYYSYLSSL